MLRNNKYILLIITFYVINSCSLLNNIFGYPVDQTGYYYEYTEFNCDYITLQLKSDSLVSKNPNIIRVMNNYKGGYDDHQYRIYKIINNSDTMEFHLVFTNKDSVSVIGVSYFMSKNIPFKTSNSRMQKKNILKYKNEYEYGLNNYRKIYLNPLESCIQK